MHHLLAPFIFLLSPALSSRFSFPHHSQSPKSSCGKVGLSSEHKVLFPHSFPTAPEFSLPRSSELFLCLLAHPVLRHCYPSVVSRGCVAEMATLRLKLVLKPRSLSRLPSFPVILARVPSGLHSIQWLRLHLEPSPYPFPSLFYGNTGTCEYFISLRLDRKQIEFRSELAKLIISTDSRVCSTLLCQTMSCRQPSINDQRLLPYCTTAFLFSWPSTVFKAAEFYPNSPKVGKCGPTLCNSYPEF